MHNFTQYFIKHPIIAVVLNLMIAFIGILSFNSLQVREYPAVHFPVVQIFANYPNASAEVVENAVTNALEDQLAAIEGINTITSESIHGLSHITLNFKKGISMDKGMIAIREAIGLASLPQEVKPPIVERQTTQSTGLPFIIVSLISSNMDFGELTHYVNLNVKNSFRSLKGVATVQVWGQPYSMKVILDEKKMVAFGINATDVYEALQRANLSLPAGKFQNQIPVTINSELKNATDFENLVIKQKSHAGAPPMLLKQIATVRLETDNKQFRVRINGQPGLCIAIQRASDANPLEVSQLIQKQVAEIKGYLPEGAKIDIITDQADFIRQSLKNVKTSIIEAVVFVLIVIFLFLRNIKAAMIPLITIPISLLGSLLFLKIFGFSINIMTLLAMVLAIGLVVDDAIVVLENIQRHLDNGESKREAAVRGAKEISFSIVAMTLTLTSVYAPLAFISGSVGDLFIEFAVALAGSVLISGIVALTLSPWMCSKNLKPHKMQHLSIIDTGLKIITEAYQRGLTQFLTYQKTCMLIFLIVFAGGALLMYTLPKEIAPKEDRGLMGVYIPPIPGKDIETMEQKILVVQKKLQDIPEATQNLSFMGDWGGAFVLPLKPQSMRKRSAQEIVEAIKPLVGTIPSLEAYPWSIDSGLPGMEDNSGQDLSLVVSTTDTYHHLFDVLSKVKKAIEKSKLFEMVSHNLKVDTPSYRIDLNTNDMSNLNITAKQIAKTVEIFFSGDQSLNFSKEGILYRITLEGEKMPWDINELYITNAAGNRISLGAIAQMLATSGPDKLYHYNQMRSDIISAALPKGKTFSQGMDQFWDAVSKEVPPTYKKVWTGKAKQLGESKNTMLVLFVLAIVFIFAVLIVQFESFIDPLIILFTAPMACLGGLSFVWLAHGSLNIYTQIGLITLIGLITKHGILIVEFVNQLVGSLPLKEAVIQAAVLRLRPILMTTAAMIFGAIPLMLAQGAGHEAQQAIGAVLIGGLLLGTCITLFVLPTICFIIKSWCQSAHPLV